MDGQIDFRDMRKTLDQAFANSKRGASKRKRLFHLDMQQRVKRGVNDIFEKIEMDIDDKLDEEVLDRRNQSNMHAAVTYACLHNVNDGCPCRACRTSYY